MQRLDHVGTVPTDPVGCAVQMAADGGCTVDVAVSSSRVTDSHGSWPTLVVEV